MTLPRNVQHAAWALLLLVVVMPAQAEEAEDPYGGTYTAAELAALDRVLHAANMTREDFTFRKDLAKGHQTLPAVAGMLRDPLTIAPFMDRAAALALSDEARDCPPFHLVHEAAVLLGEKPSWTWPEYADLDGMAFVTPTNLVQFVENTIGKAYWPLVLRGISKLGKKSFRHALPGHMAWHDVFESQYSTEESEAIKAFLDEKPDVWLHETASTLDLSEAVQEWAAFCAVPPGAWSQIPARAFPTDRPHVVDTRRGRIAIGTPNDDVYEGHFAVLIEPGGNDRYVNCRIGAAVGTRDRDVGFFADLGGDDVYECGDVNITLGAAVLGIAAFYDLGAGNDRYVGGHCSLGAAMGGVAVFYDDGGTDTYEGKTFTQGAAGFGIGIFYDDSVQEAPKLTADEGTKDPVDIGLFDNDRLSAWANAQAFARCKGVALCVNRRGNEIYEAGGVYLHAPLFKDRYQSFSQGFAIGDRGVDYAGGIAMLIDHDGNDRYLGDVYNQGVGYWYSAGLLYDGGGNDTYEMTQYGQGSGIHLAVGGLVDVSGHDTYVMHSGLGQGGSHDYAASILHDRGGNDRYLGNTSCNGSALTNSVGLHFDRSGNDTYAGRRKGAVNFGRPARGFSSIGVLLDLGGKDDYLGIMKDETLWRHTDIGVGWDLEPPPPEPAGGETPKKPATAPTTVKIPEICSYEGDLTQEVFDELWAIAIRWQVGENRTIVPKARERLVKFGPGVLPHLDESMDEGASGLEMRAYQDVLEGLQKDGAEKAVVAFLWSNATHSSDRRRTVALHLIGEMKVAELEAEVAKILSGPSTSLARRAAGVLRKLGSHVGDERLMTWLEDTEDELKLQAAMGTLLGLDTDCYSKVRVLLDHPLMSVRTRLTALLLERFETYGQAVGADLAAGDLTPRAKRTLLDVLARAKAPPTADFLMAVVSLLAHEDWGVRADAVRVIRHWEKLEDVDAATLKPARDALDTLRETEQDPYVQFWLDADKR